MGQQRWDSIFTITMIFSQTLGEYRIMNHTVGIRYLTLPPNRNFLASFERFHRLA